MPEIVTVASNTAEPRYWIVYLLFILAGFLVGGAWSAYKAGNKIATYVIAALSAITLAAALMWLIGEMT